MIHKKAISYSARRKILLRQRKTCFRRLYLLVFIFFTGLIAYHLLGVSVVRSTLTPTNSASLFPDTHQIPEKSDNSPSSRSGEEKSLPKVAIIIDDVGYDKAIAEKFMNLDAILTLSVFPYSSFGERIAALAKQKGTELMLHLPMEPMEYPKENPGTGALLTSMKPAFLTDQLEKNLNAFPVAKGVNNHMGSKMTAVFPQMYLVLSALKKRGLYFIDSYTTDDSVCQSSARLLQIPFARRDIFLDHVQKPEAVRSELRQLVQLAVTQGEAVGIGHPHPITWQVLHEELPRLKKQVRLVPASRIVHTGG